MGDRLHDVFDDRDPLRPAEAAERGVRREIRATNPARDPRVRQIIGIVGVQHRPLEHSQREVGRAAAVGIELKVEGFPLHRQWHLVPPGRDRRDPNLGH